MPAFLGFAEDSRLAVNVAHRLTLWTQFEKDLGALPADGYLAYAVRGFFQNEGSLCYVVRLDDALPPLEALRAGLSALEILDEIDLVCAPDIVRGVPHDSQPAEDQVYAMQAEVLAHCEALGDRFAILDAPLGEEVSQVKERPAELRGRGPSGANGALYYPAILVSEGPAWSDGYVPPCGHVAGVYARSDRQAGIHAAPANKVLEGVLDLERNLVDAEQGELNPQGVNCLRAFPGRGIRVWGARTLVDASPAGDPEWVYVNVRRLFLTAGRWIERNMTSIVLEPHNPRLWARIERELTAYFNHLFHLGALKGRTAEDAFYVKCDAATNPPEVRDAGMMVTEIGLAPALPSEYVVVRIIHGAGGVTIVGPTRPG